MNPLDHFRKFENFRRRMKIILKKQKFTFSIVKFQLYYYCLLNYIFKVFYYFKIKEHSKNIKQWRNSNNFKCKKEIKII